MTRTIPEPCPECNGSRAVIVLLDEPTYSVPDWRLYSDVGFSRVQCRTCQGHGVLEREPSPSIDPRIWEYRVPPEVRLQIRLEQASKKPEVLNACCPPGVP